ncbi:MarR family transcriptional regulator [Saccharolobus caldissimus]|uniref:MarR family transcriptional regulator n=2 Tax=Saccharolobus caldissimus TaxID=1702097 RepID=A0AAQ4CT23_9CREN|nr:MarR family transcriptional regulator [Saccharolobus caldissimus]
MTMGYSVFDTLRELDSIVDFARAKLQWDILFFINSKGPSSVSEIAEGTNNSKKAVIDAIRKLIDKELVVKVKYDVYDLSEKGKELLNKLNDLINNKTLKENIMENSDLASVNVNPAQYFYLIELLKAALINNDILPIERISRELGISRQTLKYYVDLFVNKKIFKKINKKSLFGKIRTCYILTSEGKKIAYKIPILIKIRNNIFLKILLKTTFSLRYESALIRLMAFLSLSAPIIIYYRNVSIVHIIGIIWLYILIFTTLLSIFAYTAMR